MAAVAVTESHPVVQGVVVIAAETGRALRKLPAPIRAAEVLDCSGDFRAGDRVYITSRSRDGGQAALAIGTADIDASALRGLHRAGAVASREALQLLDAVSGSGLRILWRTP